MCFGVHGGDANDRLVRGIADEMDDLLEVRTREARPARDSGSLQIRLVSAFGAPGKRQKETEEKCRFDEGH